MPDGLAIRNVTLPCLACNVLTLNAMLFLAALSRTVLAAGRFGGAPADPGPGRVAGELEDAPDETRAVVAAVRLIAELAGDAVGLAAPHVGHADLRDRERQCGALGAVVARQREGRQLRAGAGHR